MLRENKRKLFLSSAVILLPVLFGLIVWNRLPSTLITPWGADGKADGQCGKGAGCFRSAAGAFACASDLPVVYPARPEAAAPRAPGRWGWFSGFCRSVRLLQAA